LRRSAYRSRRPSETLALILPVARAIGVSRLAEVTGLDRIGIPVFQAIRPLSRSLTVSQGKGITPDAARVSALMEAIELHQAEAIEAETFGTATPTEAALWRRVPAAFEQDRGFDPTVPRGWVHGVDLLGGGAVRVPHGLVSMDCTIPHGDDLWPNTNGLASGNDAIEAQVGALCEAIERDSHARWIAASPSTRRLTAIDPDSIDDRAGRWLVAKVTGAGLRCALWDMSDAHGLATIGCAIIDPARVDTLTLPPAFGAGSHPRAPVALARAVLEAAQTRAALIAGSRDDLADEDYADPGAQRSALIFAMRDFGGGPMRAWRDVPDRDLPTGEAEREVLLRTCDDAGCGVVACLDLGTPGGVTAVARVVVPGFGDHDRPSAR
jgi:ribosomal protein S12 methylthiotransferase accessory factor